MNETIKNDILKTMHTAHKIYMEVLADVDPLVFQSIIGALVDTYEDDHPEFSGEKCLENILKIRDEVNEAVNSKTDEEIIRDLTNSFSIDEILSLLTK